MAQSHFLSLKDWSREEIELLFEESAAIKTNPENYRTALAGKSLGMIFQKPSTRTRVSFEVGMFQLGGQALFLGSNDIQLDRGETIADTARVLSRYVHGIMARVFAHEDILDLARHGSVPGHQRALATSSTPARRSPTTSPCASSGASSPGLKMAYVGDGNNVAHELDVRRGQARHAVRDRLPAGLRAEPAHLQERGARGPEARARRCRR